MANITKDQVIDFIANMSVLEMSEMVKEMEEKFGVSAATATMAAPAASPGDSTTPAEEQSEFNVILTSIGESHGRCVGTVLDGCPAGLDLTEKDNVIDFVEKSQYFDCLIFLVGLAHSKGKKKDLNDFRNIHHIYRQQHKLYLKPHFQIFSCLNLI